MAAVSDGINIQSVSMLSFGWHLLWNRDFHKTVEKVKEVYHAPDFFVRIPLSGRNIYFLENEEIVKAVLKAKTSLGFVNENFNITLGHRYSVNGLNMSEPLWKELHNGLLSIFTRGKRPIEQLMENNKEILTSEPTSCVNNTLKQFFLRVWGEYCFGPDVKLEDYISLRKDLFSFVRIAFHGNTWNRMPVVGRMMSHFNHYWHGKSLASVNERLTSMVDQSIKSQKGAFYELFVMMNENHSEDEAFEITRDNSFLSFLVYDFIYMISLDFMVNLAKQGSPKPADDEVIDVNRKEVFKASIERGFLFPYRFRVANEEIGGAISPNDMCLINLKEPQLFFSYGPRHCVGQGLFDTVRRKLLEIIGPYSLEMVDKDQPIEYAPSKDVPVIKSKHVIKLSK